MYMTILTNYRSHLRSIYSFLEENLRILIPIVFNSKVVNSSLILSWTYYSFTFPKSRVRGIREILNVHHFPFNEPHGISSENFKFAPIFFGPKRACPLLSEHHSFLM